MTDPNNPTSQQGASTARPAQMWAIVELMGHQRVAGALSQDLASGLPLVRIDVPAVTHLHSVWRNGAYVNEQRTIPAHSRSLSAAAIYAINWVDEAAARLDAVAIQATPLKLFSLEAALISSPAEQRQELLAIARGSNFVQADDDGGDDDHPF